MDTVSQIHYVRLRHAVRAQSAQTAVIAYVHLVHTVQTQPHATLAPATGPVTKIFMHHWDHIILGRAICRMEQRAVTVPAIGKLMVENVIIHKTKKSPNTWVIFI